MRNDTTRPGPQPEQQADASGSTMLQAAAPPGPSFVPVLDRRDRTAVALLFSVWAALLVAFWVWWLQPQHVVTIGGLAINTVILLYVSTLPIVFVSAVLRLRRFDRRHRVPNLRTALVVTKAPAEPWALVQQNLEAMLDQDFPHDYDVWLCDEAPSEHAILWCADHGVKVSSRQGVPEYHRETWPRRTRCKEGNLAYFYDHWGYRDYDVVAQLDADHVPTRSYLTEIVRPFADPDVGYVAAPSVCDTNAESSWAARGRLFKEATLHGPMQAGANEGWAPLCIGSHYAVRTQALHEIGGLGPELAEDFTTTFLLNTAGWRGTFVLDAEAHGEGPPTLSAMLIQEFQWSRSLMTVLLDLVPGRISSLPWTLRLRFAFALSYYPLLAGVTMIGVLLPLTASLLREPWVNVNYFLFLTLWASMSVPLIASNLILRRRGVLRPARPKLVGWELMLFGLTRWPFIVWGVASAMIQRVRPKPITFKVTPKDGGLEPLPARLLLPYTLISLIGSTALVVGMQNPGTRGYALLSLLSAMAYCAVSLACTALHALEMQRATGGAWPSIARGVRGAGAVSAVQVGAVIGAIVLADWAWMPEVLSEVLSATS